MQRFSRSVSDRSKVVARLASNESLLRYLLDPYIRGGQGKAIHPRIGEGIHQLLSQLASDIAALQKASHAETSA